MTAETSTAPRRAAVIGAGPVGLATAAHLARRGLSVVLSDASEEAIAPIRATGEVTLGGIWRGRAALAGATTEAAEAVRGAELILCAVPSSAHEAVARAIAQALEPGALIVLQPGATLSAPAFLREARGAGLSSEVTVVETLNTLFTGRLAHPGEVTVMGVKKQVAYASLPSEGSAAAARALEPLFPPLKRAGSILEVSLHNYNAVMHPVVTLLNAGPIDRGESFLYYVEGGTRRVMALVEAVDRERIAILEALDLPRLTVLEWYDRAYGARAEGLYELIQGLGPYSEITSPSSLQTRLLLEDVPTGLVPYCSIAAAVGVEVPLMSAQVVLANGLYGRDFWQEGRTLERLGLGGLDRDGLLRALGPARR